MNVHAHIYAYRNTFLHTGILGVFVSFAVSDFTITSTTDSPNCSKHLNSFSCLQNISYSYICVVIRCTYAYIT